jgi:hypothetical protein
MFFFFFDHVIPPERVEPIRDAVAMAESVVPDVSVSTLRTFLEIAARSAAEPCSAPQLSKCTGIQYAKMMRHLEVLGPGSRRGPGHDLLGRRINPTTRRHEIHLTAKGMELVAKLAGAIPAEETPKQLEPATPPTDS